MLIYIYLFLLIISLFITIRSIYQLITFHRVFQKKWSKAQLKAQKKTEVISSPYQIISNQTDD